MTTEDFDLPGADWLEYQTIGLEYEEEVDLSRGKFRHRRRPIDDQPAGPWVEGRAPTAGKQ